MDILTTTPQFHRKVWNMSKKKWKIEKPRLQRCDYELDYEGKKQKMVVRCKECKQNYSIANPNCINGILNSLADVYMVDYLYISHYLDTMYFGDSVELLEQMKSLSAQMRNYALRNPEGPFKHRHPKFKKKVPCPSCPINPQRMFIRLKTKFSKDLEEFYSGVKSTITEINKFQPKGEYCNTCRHTSLENMDDIFARFEDLVAFILLKAYKIVYDN